MKGLRSNNATNGNSTSEVEAESSKYYDRNIQTYSVNNQNPADFIDEFLTLFPKGKGRILDLGCGPGINSGYIDSKHFDVEGVDLSQKMIAQASMTYPNIKFHLADMTQINFPSQSFDGIFASYSIIHLPKEKIPAFFTELHRILRPGGLLYVSVQCGKSTEGFYSHPSIPDEPLFLNIFSKEEVTELFYKYGFQIISQHEKLPSGKVFPFMKLFIMAKKSFE